MRTLRNKTEASLEFLKQEHNIAIAKVGTAMNIFVHIFTYLPIIYLPVCFSHSLDVCVECVCVC